jgi:hypothetical protein
MLIQVVNVASMQDNTVDMGKEKAILEPAELLKQKTDREIETEEVIVVDPVIVMAVHDQRAGDSLGKIKGKVFQVQAVDDIPLLLQVGDRLEELDLVAA